MSILCGPTALSSPQINMRYRSIVQNDFEIFLDPVGIYIARVGMQTDGMMDVFYKLGWIFGTNLSLSFDLILVSQCS